MCSSPDDPDRHRVQVLVEHVGLVVRRRGTRSAAASAHRRQLGEGRDDGGLGRAVAVDEPQARPAPAPDQLRRQLLAAAASGPAGRGRSASPSRPPPRTASSMANVTPRSRISATRRGGECSVSAAASTTFAAGQQRHERVQHRHVERERGELQHDVGRADLPVLDHGVQEVDHVPVLDDDALGLAGRARGVDHVGHVRRGRRRRSRPPSAGRLRPSRRPACRASSTGRPGGVRQAPRRSASSATITVMPVSPIMKASRSGGQRRDPAGRSRRRPSRCPAAPPAGQPGRHADADQRLGPDAQLAQPPGDLVRQPVQLGVGDPLALVLGRDRVRGPRGLAPRTPRARSPAGTAGGVVPVDQLRPQLGRGQQRQLGQPRRRVRRPRRAAAPPGAAAAARSCPRRTARSCRSTRATARPAARLGEEAQVELRRVDAGHQVGERERHPGGLDRGGVALGVGRARSGRSAPGSGPGRP